MDVPIMLPDADAGVGGAEVDADGRTVNLSHDCFLLFRKGLGGCRDRAVARRKVTANVHERCALLNPKARRGGPMKIGHRAFSL